MVQKVIIVSVSVLYVRAGQDRARQDRTGQDRIGQDRTGQDRTQGWDAELDNSVCPRPLCQYTGILKLLQGYASQKSFPVGGWWWVVPK